MADIYGQLVKAQLENLASDPTSANGMIYYHTGDNVVKYYNGTAFQTVSKVVTTTRGDLIRRGASADERFAAVTDNRVVRGDGTDVVLGQIDDPDFFAAGAYATDSAAGTLPPAASMGNALATALGLKQYLHGTSYNGGNAPTVSGTNWTANRAIFIPYKMQDGTWRCRVTIRGDVTSGGAITSLTLTVNGLTFKNVAGFYQPVYAFVAGALPYVAASQTGVNNGEIYVYFASDTTPEMHVGGDFELESKPSWAY